MSSLVNVGVPLLIVLAMVVVGLELTPADLSRVLHYPVQVAVALLSQALLLPLIAAALIILLRLEPPIAGGLILTAAAPQAMTSNYYCLLARANVALSVTLTAASSVLAVASTPLIATLAFGLLLEEQAGFVLPAGKVMQQVVTGLLLPVCAGMLIRRYAAGFVERNRVRFQRLSMIAVGAMLAIVLTDQAATIQRNLVSIVIAAVLFTAGAVALGLSVAKIMSWSRADTVTVLAAFPSRSLSIATLIAVNVLGRLDFLSFAATFFVVQALLLIPAMLLARTRGSSSKATASPPSE
jgi:bile acid:Na+ symporter, BASS family